MPDKGPTLDRARLQHTLQACVDEVFTRMVSTFEEAAAKRAERGHARDARPEEVDQAVFIGFSGDARGRVVLRCSLESAGRIARGLLRLDEGEELDPTAVRDALGECANMLAGSLKTRALDPLGRFQLGLPSFAPPANGGRLQGALVHRAAEGVVSVEVWLDPA